jgi:hypothetical protein
MRNLSPVTEVLDVGTKGYIDGVFAPSFKDFVNGPKYFYSSLVGSAGFAGLTNGTGATVLQKSNAGREGVIECSTGSTTTGRAGIFRAHNMSGALIRPNQNAYVDMNALIKVPVLATTADEFVCGFGLWADPANPLGAAHIALVYQRTTNVNWVASTHNGTSATTAAGPAVTTDWVWLRVLGNSANTTHQFYVNNVLVGPIASQNVSTLFGLYPGVLINKTGGTTGTTARTVEFDDYLDIYYPTVVKIA